MCVPAHRQYIRWIRDGDLLLDSREPDLLPPDRFAVDAASGSLHVAAVRDADNGEYVCEVMTPHGLATQVHAIEVMSKPENRPSSQSIGDRYVLNCSVDFHLQPHRPFCRCPAAPSS